MGRFAAASGYSLIAVAISTITISTSAQALEDVVPFLTGTTIGVPVGELPPIGLYFSTQPLIISFNVKNDQGKDIGVHINDVVFSNQFLYVPNIPKIFGATYGAFIVQPTRFSELTVQSGEKFSGFGVVNTVISPINLSWKVTDGFFVSAGLTGYAPDSDYVLSDAVHIGRNYVSLEPSVGLSYIKNGFNFTLHPVIDFNFTNPANDYRSGDVLSMDYTAAYKIDKLALGVGGTVVDQFTNDTQDGTAVAAVSGIHGYGDKAKNVTVGPYISYDFGTFKMNAYYTHSVYARNTAAGDQYFMTVSLPLFSANPSKATAQNSLGER